MIKLLIADDEPLVLVGMRSMLDWASMGIELCATAHNGRQALELIEQHRPHIVITDIKMPLMSGLELAAACREKGGDLPVFIILTSYEEFDFAREAMRSGALEYLIKLELTPDTLRAAVEKALTRARALVDTEDPGAGLPAAASAGSSLQSFRDNFFTRLYGNLFDSPAQLLAAAEELDLAFTAHSYAVAACAITGVREMDAAQQLTLCTSTVQMARETLEKFGPCTVTPLDMRHFNVMFPLTAAEAADADRLPRLLRTCVDTVRRYFSVGLLCGVGEAVREPFELSVCARRARFMLGETSAASPVVCAGSGEGAELSSANYKRRVVEDVTEYIRRNLSRRLSLNEVAEAFSFSPNYLSQLFAKYADCGFVETITREKIAAAKTMLADGRMRIYEVADKLGYENAFYFSKVFKKETGQSPREYMQAAAGGKDS